MTITRNGVEIELTEEELSAAYFEQQHKFDVEDVRIKLDATDDPGEFLACYGTELEEVEPLIDRIAYILRHDIDRYDDYYWNEIDDCVRKALTENCTKEGNV